METEFDTAPVPRLVLRLGLPALLAQFFNILYSVVDRIFAGHLPGTGELALASIGVCAPLLTAVTAFATLVGTGGAAVLSISLGRRDRSSAQETMGTGFVLLALLSVVLTAALELAARPLLRVLGCSETMYPLAAAYFRLYVLGTPAVLLGAGMNQFLLAQGHARRGMCAVMLGALVNTALDPVFMFALGLGIRGAALATVLAQTCVLVFELWSLARRGSQLPLRLCPVRGAMVGRILRIGCLPFCIILLDNLLVMLLNGALRRYGGADGDRLLSCAAVVQSFMTLAYCPAAGITSGCATLYGYYYGARRADRVLQVFRCVFFLCAGYLALLCLAAQLRPAWFARLFLDQPDVLPLVAGCIRRYTAGLLGVAVQYAIVDGLTAMGQTRAALPISFFRKGLYIACVLVLPRIAPVTEVFWAATISDLLGAAVTVTVFCTRIAPRLRRELGGA